VKVHILVAIKLRNMNYGFQNQAISLDISHISNRLMFRTKLGSSDVFISPLLF